jgi:hypothetical protein
MISQGRQQPFQLPVVSSIAGGKPSGSFSISTG